FVQLTLVFPTLRPSVLEPNLNPRLAQPESLAEFLPHERVRIVCLVEQPLQFGQLLQREVRSFFLSLDQRPRDLQRQLQIRLCVPMDGLTFHLDAVLRARCSIPRYRGWRWTATQQFSYRQLQLGCLEWRQALDGVRCVFDLLSLGRDGEVFRLKAGFRRRRRLLDAATVDARRLLLCGFAGRRAGIWRTDGLDQPLNYRLLSIIVPNSGSVSGQ
ncbi:hypothetical protein WN55_10187, partial [Dufourea novaeangliae]